MNLRTRTSCLLISAAIAAPSVWAADSSAKVEKVAKIEKSTKSKSGEMDMSGMDMKNCPMMKKDKERKAYNGSAAIIADDFEWKLTPGVVPAAKKPVTFTFNINWKKNKKPLTDLEIVHEKPCHLLIVSRDLKEFQHIHPDVKSPGKMVVTTEFPKAGQYRMYMQFYVKSLGEYTIIKDFEVGPGHVKTPLAKLTVDLAPKKVDQFTMTIVSPPEQTNASRIMEIGISADGKPINNIQRYLGAGGHGVMIREDLSQFLHIHPMFKMAQDLDYTSPVKFLANVPEPGKYRAWMQFQINGKIEIGVWDIEIKPAPKEE